MADHFGLHGPKSMKMEGPKLSKICIDSMRLLNWMKYKRLQNHCVLQYSVAPGCLSEAFGSMQNCCETIAFRVFCCTGLFVRDLWINAKLLQNHSVLQYSVAQGCLSETCRANQNFCKTIVFYSILLPCGVCQRPSDQCKDIAKPLCFIVFYSPGVVCPRPMDQCTSVAKLMYFTVFCCPVSSVKGLWINAKL